MSRGRQFLQEQIVRARHFATAMNTDADRKRFEEIAADYQNELDATETTESQPPAAGEATPSSQEAAVRTNQSAAQPEAADDQNAAGPVASSKEDQGSTTD
jgi:hypothetical protein